MFFFLFIIIILSVLVGLVFSAGVFLSKKLSFDSEKMSPFECGFSPKFNARLPFSMRFFLVTLIFLIFDVELVLMFPFIMGILKSDIFIAMFFFMAFLSILILGTLHEWNQGSLDWAA